MSRIYIFLLCAFTPFSQGQQQKPADSAQGADIMIVAVSHDNSVLAGGIGSASPLPSGKAAVEPLAWLSPSGEWKKILCDDNHPKECKKFEREYLKKPHSYTVVSADGRGASVHVKEMALDDECFGYGGTGTFSGNSISYATVAASSADYFIPGLPAKRLAEKDAEPIRKALAATAGGKLDSTKVLRVYSMQLEGQDLFVIQRAFQDYADKPGYDLRKPGYDPSNGNLFEIFAIGMMNRSHFYLLFWKENTGDENEQILGTLHLKNGRDFLVTTTSDPESQFFRIYGIRNGRLTLIFSGGGGGC
jgi:hypothetical protein